MIFSWF